MTEVSKLLADNFFVVIFFLWMVWDLSDKLIDRKFPKKTKGIVLGEPTLTRDAVTKGYVDEQSKNDGIDVNTKGVKQVQTLEAQAGIQDQVHQTPGAVIGNES